MSDPSKIQHILDYLTDQLFRTWSAFLVAKYIDQALEDGRITSIRYFFVTAHLSCTESAILGLSKLTLSHGDSMNMGYLLNCCEQNPGAFENVSKDEILRSVQAHERQLAEMESLIEHARKWRDRAIAHLDRKFVNVPTSISSVPPIDMNQVEEAFILLEGILNTYRGYLGSSGIRLRNYEAGMAENWEYLIGLIQAGKSA